MKKSILSLILVAFSLGAALSSAARADDILWKLDFKDIAAGKPLTEVPYAMPCYGPQKVVTDAQNTLVGAQTLDTLSPALVFTKGSNSHYTPAFTLRANGAISTGVVTVKFDVAFDAMTVDAAHPVETLMAVPFLNAQGGSDFVLVIVATGPNDLVLGGSNLAKGKAPLKFKLGDVVHIKAVLDLDHHTFQAFLNDAPMADPEHDDQKFNNFLGLTVRDGTALGGNNGGTFTAGIANLVVSH